AVEAQFGGKLRFHGRGFSHDWIENWVSIDDSMRWDIDVVDGGLYRLTLQYVVPEEDVGAGVLLRIGGEELRVVITEAFDPELYPVHDRAKRNGELQKHWKKLLLGEIELKEGKQQLILSAEKMPGKQVMEVRSMQLEKLN